MEERTERNPVNKFRYEFKHVEDTTWATTKAVPHWVQEVANQGITQVQYTNQYGEVYEYRITSVPMSDAEKLEHIIDAIVNKVVTGDSAYDYVMELRDRKNQTESYINNG